MPPQATIRSVLRAAIGTYRRRFARIVIAAIVVFAPIDLVVTLATEAARSVATNADVLSTVVWVTDMAVSIAGTILSLILFAGVIDRIVAVDQHGHDDAPLRDILRGLPTGRLVLAGILAAALTLAGLLLLLLPGLLVMILFSLVGPLIVIEDLGAWASLRRSARLVWPHFFLVLTVVLVPAMLEQELSSWLEGLSWYEHPLVHLPIDVASTIVVVGLIGVIEVTLAHALIADEKRRRGDRAGAKLQKPNASPDGKNRRIESAAEDGAQAAHVITSREGP
jgi:hypothetical protein